MSEPLGDFKSMPNALIIAALTTQIVMPTASYFEPLGDLRSVSKALIITALTKQIVFDTDEEIVSEQHRKRLCNACAVRPYSHRCTLFLGTRTSAIAVIRLAVRGTQRGYVRIATSQFVLHLLLSPNTLRRSINTDMLCMALPLQRKLLLKIKAAVGGSLCQPLYVRLIGSLTAVVLVGFVMCTAVAMCICAAPTHDISAGFERGIE